MTRFNLRCCITVLSLASVLAMAGCKTTETPIAGKALDSLAGHHDTAEKRLSTAAAAAIAEGKTEEALKLYERLYNNPTGVFKPNKKDQDIALNYAQLLRKSGKAQQAADVLAPFMKVRKGGPQESVDPIVLNEYAASSIELGKLDKAEELLNQVLEDQKAADFHADARNLMGVALDASGQHAEAEQSFRMALENWKGDTTSVLNNLGLCLASQGKFDESLVTLRQALVMAPKKQEIARNIEMVTNLRKAIVPAAPVPTEKDKEKK